MRYKSIIDDNITTALQTLANLKSDLSNEKPHVTVEYMTNVISHVESKLETAAQYLEIEE